MMHTEGLVC